MKKILLSTLFLGGALCANAQWNDQPSNGSQNRGVRYINIVNDKTVWTVLYDGSGSNANIQEMYKTIDGQTWRKIAIANASGAYGISNVSGVDTSIAFAAVFPAATATTKQGIYKTVDGGATWTKVSGTTWGATSFLNGVYFWDAAQGFAFGDPVNGNFQIQTTNDSGTTWTNAVTSIAAASSGEYAYTGVFDVVGDQAWVATNSGRILHSTDKGLNWTVAQAPLADVNEVKFFSPSWGFAREINSTTSVNALVETLDSGNTWQTVNFTGNFFTAGFDIMPQSGILIATGSAQGAMGTTYSRDSGRTWVDLETAAQRLDVAFYSDSIGWCGAFSDASGFTGMFGWDPTYNDAVTAIKSNIQKGTHIAVYPNPNNGTFVLDFRGNTSNNISVKVLNVLGSEVYSQISKADYWTRKQITLPTTETGIYFIEVTDGTQKYTTKMIIK